MNRALAAAVYFDADLSANTEPIRTLCESLFGAASLRGPLVQWATRVDGGRQQPPKLYKLEALLRAASAGQMRTIAVESPPDAADAERAIAIVMTTPAEKLPDPPDAAWRYRAIVGFGTASLDRIGAARVIDAVIAFASVVAATAGLVLWGETADYAITAAWAVGASNLPKEDRDRLSAHWYWQPRWGQVIRGPAWGTFLGATHVATLGGIERIERESGCARVVRLASGGAYLQATAESMLDRNTSLAALTAFLAPVMPGGIDPP